MTDLVTDCTVPRYSWLWGTFAKATLERTVEPEEEPIALAEMKRHLTMYESVTTEDGDVTDLIQGAREWVEEFTSRALIDQTWKQTVEGNFGPEIRLHRSPVLAVSSVKTVDSTGAETTVDPATYELRKADSKWPTVVMLDGSRFQDATVRIVFRAGFVDRSSSPGEPVTLVPFRFRQAMKLWATANYRGNGLEDAAEVMDAAENLIKSECADTHFA